VSKEGIFPDWQKLIPSQSDIFASFDTIEAIKAISSLKSLADDKVYSVDLTLADGKVIFANTYDRGQAELSADIVGQGFIRVDGGYLFTALKACGGMAQMMLQNSYSPIMLTTDGYRVVVMPMLSEKSKAEQEADKPKAKPQPEADHQPVKAKSSRAKEPTKSRKNA
jgi:DNA polymerase III sliding clamp (beta) subunit (PCNA family)